MYTHIYTYKPAYMHIFTDIPTTCMQAYKIPGGTASISHSSIDPHRVVFERITTLGDFARAAHSGDAFVRYNS